MCGDGEGGEQKRVLPFIFSSTGQMFVEHPLCARQRLRRGGEQDARGPCPHGAHSQLVEGMPWVLYGKLMDYFMSTYYVFRNSYLAKHNFFL